MLNFTNKIDKQYNNLLNNPTPENVQQLKKIIIENNLIDNAFDYLNVIGYDDDIVNYLLKKTIYEEFVLERLIAYLGVELLAQKIVGLNDFSSIFSYLDLQETKETTMLIKVLEEHIINDNNVAKMYTFATAVTISDKEKIADAIIKTNNSMYIRKMAEIFPDLVQKLAQGILETEDVSEIIKFMILIKGCPVGYMLKRLRIDKQGKIILVSELLKNDVVKYHFYTDAIINGKNVEAQDETYMQYCKSNDKSLKDILTQDLQLKNHAKILKKVYK